MDMSAIFISEFITSQALETLKKGHEVRYEPEAYQDPQQLAAAIKNTDALIVRNLTKVNSALIEGAQKLKVVGRLGVGLENIDLPACAQRNIKVIPATGANAESVAEYVLGTSMALMRSYSSATVDTLSGAWPRPKYSKCHEIAGSTLGIVGFGSIGRVVAEKAFALGMKCIAYDPLVRDQAIALSGGTVTLYPLETLLAESQIVTLHLPLLPETKGLFSAGVLDNMQEGAFLINTARGGIVDETALAERLRSGRLGGAALDVFANEPAKELSHLLGVPNLILTPHIAGVTEESNARVSNMIAREVKLFLESQS
ncbi:SerA Phosphoglycerate dehydrogenase and related dehydrogenases [Burkholderiaceae bacterium]